MRTSNRILLGIFLVPLIILAFVNVALYAKYKTGRYISMKKVQEDRFMRQPLKNINHVAVYGLNNFNLMVSGSPSLEIEKERNSYIHFTINGDSLIIHGDSIVTRPGKDSDTLRSFQSVNLYLPLVASVIADNSSLNVAGAKDSLKAISCHFLLTHSTDFAINRGDSNDSAYTYFKELHIDASYSPGIELNAYTRVFSLHLNLSQSDFTDNGASIDKLVIDADKASGITLKGDNLRKLNAAR